MAYTSNQYCLIFLSQVIYELLRTLVAPFMAVAICSLLLSVCIRNDTACSCTLICVNFWIYLRVRTRSLASILQAFYNNVSLYQL